MKILVSVDIEGVAGVYHGEQVRPGNPEYERARRLMTAEANAAIAGAFDAGADEVYVNDSHGLFRNLLPDLLDERAQVIQGKPRYLSMVAGVDLGMDGVIMVGYHSRAHGRGILAHTISSFAFAAVEFHGEAVGEAAIYGALAGEYGAPVIMASGDDVFIEENRPLFPNTIFVQTKRATGRNSGISLSPAKACDLIRAGAASAVEARGSIGPYRVKLPLDVTIRTQSPDFADLFCQWPGLRRTAPDALEFQEKSVERAVRIINCCSAMSAMLR